MELFAYLLKVSACSAVFFAFYLLVLRKFTFFRINRFYLLLSLVISFTIPALQFTIEREAVIVEEKGLAILELSTLSVDGPLTSVKTVTNFNWLSLLPYLYGVIVVALLGIAFWRLFQLLKYMNAAVKGINGLKLVTKGVGFTNCSFFNYVFVDENSLTTEELSVLLTHEQVHANQYHSVDRLLLTLMKAVLWFNPIIYLYDKALEQTHEYEADELTSLNVGAEIYATLLLNLVVTKNQNPLIHNFVKSPIKQRINMLFNSKSKNMKKLSYLLALPVVMGLVWLFATEVVYATVKENSINTASMFNNEPFLERVKAKDASGYVYEKVTINSPGKLIKTGIYTGKNKTDNSKLWFFINSKLYTEAEAHAFAPAFVNKLSTTKGFGFAAGYDIPGLEPLPTNIVFWFGNEPKLSEYAAKNRAIYQKYNGTTVSGTVVESVMDGFILKTNNGVLLKAYVEPKFVKQANAMIKKGDGVTLKIYNAGYRKDYEYPVLSSFKLMKGDKVLFDRWPKVASVKTSFMREKKKDYEYSAQDSTVLDKASHIVHLYGNARLKTPKGELLADEIHYNLKTNQGTVVGARIPSKSLNH